MRPGGALFSEITMILEREVTPEMEEEIQHGARFILEDNGVQLVSPNGVDALIDQRLAFTCGNPHCNKLHLFDDASWKEINEVLTLADCDAIEA